MIGELRLCFSLEILLEAQVDKLKLLDSYSQEAEIMAASIKGMVNGDTPLRILEAGCGQRWPLNLDGIKFTLTGVDMDKDAVEIRKAKFKDLDEIILGDLRTVNLQEHAYDVIYSSFVLEHVQNAEQVMNNFSKWLKPGGLLIIRIPDRDSVYGFITRHTPFWFHIFYKKYIVGAPNAGKPGFDPYPTFHEEVISRQGMHKFCQKSNFEITEEYGEGSYLKQKGAASSLTRLVVITMALLSFGALEWKYNNLTYVIKKK